MGLRKNIPISWQISSIQAAIFVLCTKKEVDFCAVLFPHPQSTRATSVRKGQQTRTLWHLASRRILMSYLYPVRVGQSMQILYQLIGQTSLQSLSFFSFGAVITKQLYLKFKLRSAGSLNRTLTELLWEFEISLCCTSFPHCPPSLLSSCPSLPIPFSLRNISYSYFTKTDKLLTAAHFDKTAVFQWKKIITWK